MTAENTCHWLSQNLQYIAWLRKPRGILWIKGHPGTGKSVLMKYAVSRATQFQQESVVTPFFMHGQGIYLQKTAIEMYRAFLNSLLGHFPLYLEQITQTFNDQQRRYGSYAEGKWEWADEELRVVLTSILIQGSKTHSKPIVLFIDALDECGGDLAEQLLSELLDIMEAAEHKESPVKICISSRYYPVLDVESIPTVPV